MFGRTGGAENRELMPDSDWYLIDLLLQDASVITRKLGSKERTAQAWERLRRNCENDGVVQEVLLVAESGI